MGEFASRNPASFHSGGVNVALCDGSDRFIKETIDTWQNNPNTGYPPGIGWKPHGDGPIDNGAFTIAAGTYFGVWQKVSTNAERSRKAQWSRRDGSTDPQSIPADGGLWL